MTANRVMFYDMKGEYVTTHHLYAVPRKDEFVTIQEYTLAKDAYLKPLEVVLSGRVEFVDHIIQETENLYSEQLIHVRIDRPRER